MLNREKVVLTYLPRMATYVPPLSIALLKSCVENKGYVASNREFNIDLYTHLPPNERKLLGAEHSSLWCQRGPFENVLYPIIRPKVERWVDELARDDAALVGFSLNRDSELLTRVVIDGLKKRCPEKLVVVGGPNLFERPVALRTASNPNVDFTVIGEGEETLVELMDHLNRGEGDAGLYRIDGLMFTRGGKLVENRPRAPIRNLDAIPYPNFAEVPLGLYERRVIPIWGSRGCVRRCVFCTEGGIWGKFRTRSADSIVHEMETQHQHTGCDNFTFVDSLINGDIAVLDRVCQLLSQKHFKLYWGANIAVRKEMDHARLARMRQAGCRWLFIGIESGSQAVLDSMRKGFAVREAENLLTTIHSLGMKTGVYWLVGFPTETDAHFQESIDFVVRNRPVIDTLIAGFGCTLSPAMEREPAKYGLQSLDPNAWRSTAVTPEILKGRVDKFRAMCRSFGFLAGDSDAQSSVVAL